MYRPEYDFQKKQRSSLVAPTIILGLLFSVLVVVLFGLTPSGFVKDRLGRSPASASAPSEERTNLSASNVAAAELVEETPSSLIAASSRGRLILAPGFVLPDLFDESLSRSLANYSGRPVILNFWASWCVPCKEEMPALQRAYEEYRDEGLVVLGVNQTFVDDLDEAREFVNKLALTFPNVRDDSGNTSEGLYRVIGLPTSVLITPAGEIAHKQIGQMTDEQIVTLSRQLVDSEKITP